MCYYLNHVGTRNMIFHCILALDIFYRRPTSVHQFRSSARQSLHIVVSSQRLFSKRLSMVVIHVFCTWYEVKNQGIKLLICLNYLPVEQIKPDGIARHWDCYTTQLALRRWPNVGIGRHRRDRQPTSRQRWYSVACVATVCWHSVGARRLAYRSLPMFCVWTSVVGIKCFSNKCCRSTRLSIHQLHI